MGDLADLIARLEKATEGSRELDDAIAGAVLEYAGSVRLVGMPDSEASIKTFRRHAEGAGSSLRFTTSLDAALTLVPEGWSVRLYIHPEEFGNHADLVRLGAFKDGGRPVLASACAEQAATPALALCIAALKARAS